MKKNPSLAIMILLLLISSGFVLYQTLPSILQDSKELSAEEIKEQTIRKQLKENPNLGRIAVVTIIPSPCTDETVYNDITAASETPKGPEDVCTFDFSGRGMGKIPEEIAQFKNVSVIGLRGNNLNEFPNEILSLTKLTRLGLIDNNITEIPSEITRLTNLQVLNLNDNKLVTLPDEFGHLTNLEHLFLDNNQIQKLPQSVYQLDQLQTLSLIGNPLSDGEKEKIVKEFPNTKVIFQL